MNRTLTFFRSSLGSKYLMAITGLIGYGFLIGHIGGNLLVFLGQDAVNSYAVGLRELPFQGLWIARSVLIAAVIIHVTMAVRLKTANLQARPVKYAKDATRKASLASRSMALTGALVFTYLIFHLAHFTWRVVAYDGPYVDAQGRDDVYSMIIASFQQPLIALIYVIAMIIVGVHLSHGAKSMFQSLGINHPHYNSFIEKFPPLLGWIVAVAGVAIPVAVLTGMVQ